MTCSYAVPTAFASATADSWIGRGRGDRDARHVRRGLRVDLVPHLGKRLTASEDLDGPLEHDPGGHDVRLLGQVDLAVAAAQRVAAAEDAGAARVGEDQDGLGLVADGKQLREGVAGNRPEQRRRDHDHAVAQQGRHDAWAVGPCFA